MAISYDDPEQIEWWKSLTKEQIQKIWEDSLKDLDEAGWKTTKED